MDTTLTRNFSIIAHIDHGKTTLSDRLLEYTQTVAERDAKAQLLDAMDLEREKGITIKSHPVTMAYTAKDGKTYKLNLLDTPGHVDFSYEVSRSLAACEGAILIIDAAQGVEAQTMANVNLALDQDLAIVPVLNKIDLPAADVDKCRKQIEDILAIPGETAIPCSAKQGLGIQDILEAVIELVPPPVDNKDGLLRASVFDSLYDAYRGVISYVRVMSGTVKKGDRIKLFHTDNSYEVKETGVFIPGMKKTDYLSAGDVGYLIANMKTTAEIKIGDTITNKDKPCPEPLPGFKEIRPMVFSGIYPIDTSDYEALKVAMGKLQINDAAFTFQNESSTALGFGFRCGFLGLLHLEVIRDRIEREYDIELITTAPSVIYHVYMRDGTMRELHNPADMPDLTHVDHLEEPRIQATILVPDEYLGDVLKLCQDRRGIQLDLTYAGSRAMVVYDLPLNEVVFDFYDRLKSVTKGYASFDYQMTGYQTDNLVKMSVLVNDEPVDALSMMVHRDRAEQRGRAMVEKLKDLIPRHMFKIPIQAAIGGKVIARETLSALRKDVTAKCYGGDASRKRKLLDKQKAGKKKMRQFGKVDIPQEAFISALKMDS